MITVRRAEAADLDELARVHIRSWQHGYRDILADEFLDGMKLEPKRQRWQGILDDPEQPVWIVQADSTLVGFASTGPSRDADLDASEWRELVRLYLLPEAWGTGAAQMLARECLDDSRQHFLWVLSDNARAQAFYRKFGFVADGAEKPLTVGDRTVQELRMRRPAHA